jgi:hypothetical protein
LVYWSYYIGTNDGYRIFGICFTFWLIYWPILLCGGRLLLLVHIGLASSHKEGSPHIVCLPPPEAITVLVCKKPGCINTSWPYYMASHGTVELKTFLCKKVLNYNYSVQLNYVIILVNLLVFGYQDQYNGIIIFASVIP